MLDLIALIKVLLSQIVILERHHHYSVSGEQHLIVINQVVKMLLNSFYQAVQSLLILLQLRGFLIVVSLQVQTTILKFSQMAEQSQLSKTKLQIELALKFLMVLQQKKQCVSKAAQLFLALIYNMIQVQLPYVGDKYELKKVFLIQLPQETLLVLFRALPHKLIHYYSTQDIVQQQITTLVIRLLLAMQAVILQQTLQMLFQPVLDMLTQQKNMLLMQIMSQVRLLYSVVKKKLL